MRMMGIHSRAQIFDASFVSSPAVLQANIAGVQSMCDSLKSTTVDYHMRYTAMGRGPFLGRFMHGVRRRRIDGCADYSEDVRDAARKFLDHPGDSHLLNHLHRAIERFEEERIEYHSQQAIASASLLHEAGDPRPSMLQRLVLGYMTFKKRFPSMGDLPISMLALNGGELAMQGIAYGAIAHPERFAWTIPFSLVFSPMANALVTRVGRVVTNGSKIDSTGERFAAAGESMDITTEHRNEFRSNLKGFFSMTGGLRIRKRLKNLKRMMGALRVITRLRRGEIRRAWEFYKIGFWLDALQIGALATTGVVATGCPYDVGGMVSQYFKSLAFNAGLMAADYPTQNYLPIHLRVPASLVFRASSLIFMGWITLPK